MHSILSPSIVCPICSRRYIAGPIPVCPECYQELLDQPGPFQTTIRVADREIPCMIAVEYRGIAKRAIELVKRKGDKRILTIVADLLVQPLLAAGPQIVTQPVGQNGESTTVLIPVPASVIGRHRRGFDQTEEIVRRLGHPWKPFLHRKRGTQQKRLGKSDRRMNALEQYFVPAPRSSSAPVCENVTLVDDVLTTGATVERCASLLFDHGYTVRQIVVCMASR